MNMWIERFRARGSQVESFLLDNGFDKLDTAMSMKILMQMREPILGPKGTKLLYRGSGWWMLHGYSDYDRIAKLPTLY